MMRVRLRATEDSSDELEAQRPERDVHTLVIGGTGMLADLSVELARRSEVLTLVASTRRSLEVVAGRLPTAGPSVHLLRLSWSDPSRFLSSLRRHVETVGPPALTVAWLHDDSLGPSIAEAVCGEGRPATFVQVMGSQSAVPGGEQPPPALSCQGQRYQRVILGFEQTGSGSRWLTHEEISGGVLAAIDSHEDRVIVGRVEPWSERPGASTEGPNE